MPKLRIGAIALTGGMALLLLTACAGGKAAAEGSWGTEADNKPLLVLEHDGSLHGTDGCNRLMGAWKQSDDGTIDFGEVATTMMACEGVDTWLSTLSTGELKGQTMHVFDGDGNEIGTLTRHGEH